MGAAIVKERCLGPLLLPLLLIPPLLTAASYETALAGLHFRAIGPATQGGRIDTIAVVQQNPDTFYVGAATGGLWKTTNGGTTFQPLFEELPALTVGDVAIAPSNPSILWLGSGEPNNRQSSTWGSGVYKSTDAGRTWTAMGLADTQAIGRIAIDPRNPDVVYVAALGHLWGPNAERGLFKTEDGGKTWKKSLFIDNDTGVVDVAIDPRSPNILYAAAYERRRAPWGFNGGGPGSAIYKSTDSGLTWRKLTSGLPPTGNLGRIGLALYRRNPDILYAIVEGRGGGVFRSEDQGETWKQTTANTRGSAYFSQIRIDPNNDLRLWVLLDFLASSKDGGKTFTPDMRTDAHWDFHEIWIDPANSNHMIAATDGGVYTSADAGATWVHINNLPLGQIYHAGYDFRTPYTLCGGFQDNGVICGPSRTRSAEGIANADWQHLLTGDGINASIDPADPGTIYTGYQDGNLVRLDVKRHEWKPITPEASPGEAPYRFDWQAPVLISAHHPNTLYFAGNFLFKSTDRGDTWTKVSPDLTTGVDRNKLQILGKTPGPNVVSSNYGVLSYPAITALAESPVDANVLWAGTQDGNLQVTRDGGKTWKNVASAVPGVPSGTWVAGIAASRSTAGAAYVAFDAHRSDDFRAYAFATTDFGASWKPIISGLSGCGSVRVLAEDPGNPNLLFAGTEHGAYVSFNKGADWQKMDMGLPNVPVYDILIHPREHDLILATHGRSFYVLDEIRPLEELTPDALQSDLRLFSTRPAITWRLFISSNGYNGDRYFTAPNPPPGTAITYYLKTELPKDQKVAITIRDSAGAVVQKIEDAGHAGLNRVVWDARYTTTAKPLDLQVWAAQQGFLIYHSLPGLGMPAPLAQPGRYSIEVAASGKTAQGTVEVQDDPNVSISAADRTAHFDLEMQSFHLYLRAYEMQKSIVAMEEALTSARDGWKKNSTGVPSDLQKAVGAFASEVAAVRAEIAGGDSSRPDVPLVLASARLLYLLEANTAAPTPAELARYRELDQRAKTDAAKLETELTGRLAELNKKMRDAGIPYISAATPK